VRGIAILLLVVTVLPAAAQGPAPLVRARIEPAAVTVGEPAHVVVDVLTPTWFLEPPRFPTLDVADAVVLFQERGANLSEAIAGSTYSGIQREYLVVPMREGRFTIPPIEVTLVWAVEAKPSKPTALATKPLWFDATIPAAARGLGTFVSARRLELRQALEPHPTGLAVGGSLRRTVTIEAEDAFGMMLPPIAVPAIDGLAAYPDPPQVEDRAGARGEARVARRIESVSFRLEREGSFRLPAVEIAWWDVGARRMRRASLPAVAFSVAPAPARADEIPLPAAAEAATAPTKSSRVGWAKLLPWLAAGIVAIGLAGRLVPPLVRLLRRLQAGLAAARLRRLDSELAWFARVRRAAAEGDAPGTYQALLGWVRRRAPAGSATLDSLVGDAGDPDLAREIGRLGEALYGGSAGGAWNGDRLVRSLEAARRRALRGHAETRVGLGPLNPGAGALRKEGATTGGHG